MTLEKKLCRRKYYKKIFFITEKKGKDAGLGIFGRKKTGLSDDEEEEEEEDDEEEVEEKEEKSEKEEEKEDEDEGAKGITLKC